MVRQLTFNLHLLSMLVHVYSGCQYKDVFKALIFFSFLCYLQSIRDDKATTSNELIFFYALPDVLITLRKTRVEVANDVL